MSDKSLSVVVPVYNGALTLKPLLQRLIPVLKELVSHYEIILVNDGSSDQSWQKIEALAQEYAAVRGINMMRNYGQHNVLLCGIRAAHYELIVTMDDDLQHLPEEIPKLLDKLSEGNDIVYGLPKELPHSCWRNFFSRLIKRLLTSLIGVRNFSGFSAFRAFRSEVRDAFSGYNNPDVNIDVLISWGTTRFAAVFVSHSPLEIGKSNYTFRKLFNVAMQVITTFSTAPLRIASLVGFSFVLFGFVIFSYVVYVYFFLNSVPGFPFLVSIIALFSGAQLFALGIIGEYLAKIFLRSMNQPPYLVRETTDISCEERRWP